MVASGMSLCCFHWLLFEWMSSSPLNNYLHNIFCTGSSSAPEFDFGLPTSIIAGYGDNVEIPCVVKGIPAPIVKWKNVEGNLKQKTKVFVDEKNTLIIMVKFNIFSMFTTGVTL